jgi:hypothetical protein
MLVFGAFCSVGDGVVGGVVMSRYVVALIQYKQLE